MVVLLVSCNRSPISGLADAMSAYVHSNITESEELKLREMPLSERRKYLSKWEQNQEQLKNNILYQASKLDGTSISVANDEISEIEPLKLTLVDHSIAPKFVLNGKFKLEKDIELDVWNEWHAERLRNGGMARVDLASPKVEEEGVYDQANYNMLACVSVIPVSVENGVIIAKAGTVIDIINAEWSFDLSKWSCEKYKHASKIWLQPVGIVAKRKENGSININFN